MTGLSAAVVSGNLGHLIAAMIANQPLSSVTVLVPCGSLLQTLSKASRFQKL
jgi:hypothetical protein